MTGVFKRNESWNDKTAFILFFLFLLTLTNSIFLNQLGYYGALIFLLIKYFSEKTNPFSRNGLETALLLYIAVLGISTLLSVNQPQSIHNLLKRVLLLPVIYTTVAVITTKRKLKQAVVTFITAAIIVVLVYLYHSYDYFIQNLYHIQESGPSVFQYPITASELMSIILIFCFVLAFNKELTLKWRIASMAGFILTALALLATYKRTGWLAALAGIAVVLMIRKQWKLLSAGIIVLLIIALMEKNYSEIVTFSLTAPERPISVEETAGRASKAVTYGNRQYIADYEGGLIVRDEKGKAVYDPGSAVLDVMPMTDNIVLTYLIDSRFVAVNLNSGKPAGHLRFTSPGFTYHYSVHGNKVYTVDKESYLTRFTIRNDSVDSVSFPEINNFQRVYQLNNKLILFSASKGMVVYEADSAGGLTQRGEYSEMVGIQPLGVFADALFLNSNSSMKIISINADSISVNAVLRDVSEPMQMDTSQGSAWVWNSSGDLWRIEADSNGVFRILSAASYGFLIRDIDVKGDSLYLLKYKRSRLSSFYDKYNMSNMSRLAFWTAGWKMFLDYPLFGVGDIDLRDLYAKYKRPYDKEIQGHMHNNFMHILVTLGAIGFIIFLFLIIKAGLLLYKNAVSTVRGSFINSVAIAAFASFIAFLVAGLTEWNFGDHEIITMVWFITGLSIASRKIASEVIDP